MITKLVLISFMMLASFSCSDEKITDSSNDQDFPTAAEVIKDMGPGFNLGNTFDNGYNPTNFEDIGLIITLYKNAGLKHIRIPTTWLEGFGGNSLADETGKVKLDHERLAILKNVIDFAIGKDLYVVLNTHHERAFKEHYDGSAAMVELFTNLWTDIATIFESYDHHLIFEILNEPEGAFGSWGGSIPTSDPRGLLLTRKVMAVGVDAIRATGGKNLQRTVMIATNGQGNHNQIDDVYPDKSSLPGGGTDKYLSIQVHSYDPWSFCGESGNNSEYPGDVALINSLKAVAAHGRKLDVPLNYGEYGVGRNGNQNERNTDLVRGYYKTFVETALQENMSTTVWDDRGWFGLITKSGNSYTFTYNIVPFMLSGVN